MVNHPKGLRLNQTGGRDPDEAAAGDRQVHIHRTRGAGDHGDAARIVLVRLDGGLFGKGMAERGGFEPPVHG